MNAWIFLLVVAPMVAVHTLGDSEDRLASESSYGFNSHSWTFYGYKPKAEHAKSNWGITYGRGGRIVRCFPPKHPKCRGTNTRN
ncbi:hypothetical protein L596_030580 [Steinernema carpocapsae]|uniref:Uncharacterized protein n=1 Tax=Steinernema carpocapsae TaxID=34508 RepID=A0A4U5LPS2_STECR|nr:hypothetical protein L596_030580 [Steinernema carpocapsae]